MLVGRNPSLASLACLILLTASHAAPMVDPETGRIRMLMIGETGPHNQQATYHLFSDPMVDLTVIPAGDVADVETSKRFVRIYIPRSFERLSDNYDVIELFDFVPYVLLDDHIRWMRDAVGQRGLGLALVEMGWYSVSDWTGNDAAAWMATVLYEAYPCDLVVEKQNLNTFYMDLVIEDPIVKIPGLEKVSMTEVGRHGIQVARQGSKVYTVWRARKEDAIVGGSYGQGTTLMIPMGWDNIPTETVKGWDYYVDFVLNHAYFVANVPVPDDPDLARSLRIAFGEYLSRRSLASSLVEFVDRFGASTHSVERTLGKLEKERQAAANLYIAGDYHGAWELLQEIFDGFQSLSEESMKLKDRAFFWIYLIEWLAVTGTLLACGTIIWSLMIRRLLYREVMVTRQE